MRSASTKKRPLLVVASFALTIAGIFLLPLFRYFRKILDQPLLADRAVSVADSVSDRIEHACEIAADNLRAGIERRHLEDGTERLILCAGLRNFREPWARDTGFASLGLLELGEYEVTRQALEIFLLTQRDTGQFPVKIHSTSVLDRYMHSLFKRQQPIDRPIKPKYITAHNTISLDGNALLIMAILNYATRTGDIDFARRNWFALKHALVWLSTHEQDADHLLHQGAFTDWADSIARQGKVLYTNVIYWKAIHDMAEMAERLEWRADQETLAAKAAQIRVSIQDHFWRSDLGYFVTSQIFDNLNSSGNLLAIAWGLTTEEQAHRILDAMRAFGMADPVPTQPVHRAYPRKFVALENRLGGVGNYHINFAWLWLGGWHAVALARCGRMEEARQILDRMAQVIVRDGEVHEVYAPDGAYASTFWYTSEAPLTWSAGMYVFAVREFERLRNQDRERS